MYEIHIESSEFKGKRTIQQHQLVNQVKPLPSMSTVPASRYWQIPTFFVALYDFPASPSKLVEKLFAA